MASLVDYAVSDRQREAILAYEKHGTIGGASRELGIHRKTLGDHIRKVKLAAAIRGWSPEHDMTKTVPEPYVVKGTSTLYDEDGKQKLQWVKTSVEHEKLVAMMREVIDEMRSDVKPIKPVKLIEKMHQSDMLNLYTLSDAHLGMLAWHEDGGADWDVTIAERVILDAFDCLTQCSPNSSHGIFAQLGDGLHSDGMIPVTPGHGHVLDQDSRFHKVVRAAVRIFRSIINKLLAKHETVTVLMAQGNHDPASSVWLQEMFSVLYEQNKRVNVVVSPKPYYAIEHGDVMLGFHHGHKTKPTDLPEVFMGEFREMYGRTKQTYIHCGHLHSVKVLEMNSAIVEQHRTVAARDAYASHNGYRSGRSMNVVTYHKKRLKCFESVYQIETVKHA
jgi:hypothetical protein